MIVRWNRFLKKFWITLSIVIILLAIIFSIFRALTPWASQYKADVERHLSLLLGQPVTIDTMETSWYWLNPVLKLNQVTVVGPSDHSLKIARLMVGINVFSSLWHWQLQPGLLYVDELHLTLHQLAHGWRIDGLRQDKQMTTLDEEAYFSVFAWLLGQQKIVINHVSALVYLKNGSLLPLTDLTIMAVNHEGHYRFKGHGQLAQTIATELSVLADIYINPYNYDKTYGQIYLSLHRFLPTQWESLFPSFRYHLDGGDANLDVWLDVAKGKLSSVQTRFDLDHVVWTKTGDARRQFIQSLQANLAWLPTPEGWKLSGDHIRFNAGGVDWPDNAFLLDYQRATERYDFFVKSILLKPLMSLDIPWPEAVQSLVALRPTGQLHDFQLGINNGSIDKVLSSFSDLGWQSWQNFPAVSHLSGALSWDPEGGRLGLDGEQTTLSMKGLAPVVFSQVNTAMTWKNINNAMRISLEQFVLEHPGFLIKAQGTMDNALAPEARHLQLTADYSAENITPWLAYIPKGHLKPKLESWLKKNIKKISNINGQLVVDGVLADFPFDTQPGTFTVDSHLTGTDLWFDRDWPIINDIDMNLQVRKRDLNLDLIKASLSGTEVTKANLQINGIGLGKETLLLHQQAEVSGTNLRSYLLKTPLRHRLKKLKQIHVKGPLQLDLHLEAPLYPENDDIWARGSLSFKDNQAVFNHILNDIKLTNVSGLLTFDEEGITDSELKSTLFGEPVDMTMRAVHQPSVYTEVKVVGNTSIDSLQKHFDAPLWRLMDGDLSVQTILKLPHNRKEVETLSVETDLANVSIELPAPLGKPTGTKAPLQLSMDFLDLNTMRIHANYDDRLKGDLQVDDDWKLTKGIVLLGQGKIGVLPKNGLSITGSIPKFDVNQWRDVGLQLSKDSSSVGPLKQMDLKFGEVSFLGKKYPSLALKANKLDEQTWSLQLKQQKIDAMLTYQQTSNSLSGHMARLLLDAPPKNQASNNSLKPRDIPNLDLTIDQLKIGSMDIGKTQLKSTSTEKLWHMETGKVTSKGYQISMTGDWSYQDGKHKTDIQTTTHIDDLDACLRKWGVTPAIASRNGDIQLNANWAGAINDVSLGKINGTMAMNFNKGQITNLSPETEEKLGLGKLLSILSLQTIPRRLQLDFSDLSNKGYSFDVLKGSFTIKEGVLSTNDTYIDGPVAYANMKGDLNVAKKLYDVRLHVSPHITASLPIVATIAGGPIAGVATWVASKIINQGMQQVTGYTYKITGPWANPVVEQVSIYKKKTKS
jgi:uncharacterized protein (TIGR02099 family)